LKLLSAEEQKGGQGKGQFVASSRSGRKWETGRTCRPYWFLATRTSMPSSPSHPSLVGPSICFASKIMPAQVPHSARSPPSFAVFTISCSGSYSPLLRMRSEIVVDSPPGMMRARQSARSTGVRTATTSSGGENDGAIRWRAATCSEKEP
jgi:hypothetical protein